MEIFKDELIRENARLVVQQEADQMRIADLREQVTALTAELSSNAGVIIAGQQIDALRAKLAEAVKDVNFLLNGGDRCEVCKTKCLMGADCTPVWRGDNDA